MYSVLHVKIDIIGYFWSAEEIGPLFSMKTYLAVD